MFNPKLPLWNRVIFVDWNGVLSRDTFWTSILGSDAHPLHDRLKSRVRHLFQNGDLINRWMRGDVGSTAIIDALDMKLDARFADGFLQRRLSRDCQEMEVNGGLIGLLSRACARAFVVIATDNMDCFYEQVLASRYKRRSNHRVIGRSPTLKNVVWRFDDILCSSAVGTLKRDGPETFFGRWLERHDLSFQEALLLDDREANCCAFIRAGGEAIRVLGTDFEEDFRRLAPLISEWLDNARGPKESCNA